MAALELEAALVSSIDALVVSWGSREAIYKIFD